MITRLTWRRGQIDVDWFEQGVPGRKRCAGESSGNFTVHKDGRRWALSCAHTGKLIQHLDRSRDAKKLAELLEPIWHRAQGPPADLVDREETLSSTCGPTGARSDARSTRGRQAPGARRKRRAMNDAHRASQTHR